MEQGEQEPGEHRHAEVEERAETPDGGVGRAEPLPADDRRERAEGRTVEEDEAGLGEEAGDEGVPDGEDAQDVGERHRADGHRAQQVGDDHDPAPVEPVGERTGDQAEEEVGQPLDEGDEGGERRAAAEPVDEHREGDGGDEGAGDGDLAGEPVAPEVGVVSEGRRHPRSLGQPGPPYRRLGRVG